MSKYNYKNNTFGLEKDRSNWFLSKSYNVIIGIIIIITIIISIRINYWFYATYNQTMNRISKLEQRLDLCDQWIKDIIENSVNKTPKTEPTPRIGFKQNGSKIG